MVRTRFTVMVAVLLALALAGVAGEEMRAFGIACWNPPGDAFGASLRYTRVHPHNYLLLDCGVRALTDAEWRGLLRVEAGVPLARWRGGMLGAGASASWFWEPRHHAMFDGLIESAGEDREGDAMLDSFGRTLMMGLLVAMLDAVISPVSALGDNGARIRPALSLRQSLGDGYLLQLSHDFGRGAGDPFNATTVALEYVTPFSRFAAPGLSAHSLFHGTPPARPAVPRPRGIRERIFSRARRR